MISFFDNTDFDGFGPSSWATAYNRRTATMPLGADNASVRQSIREHCPAVPGVYGMVSLDRELIYVGQSKSLQNRLLSYFTGEPVSGKVRRIVDEAASLVWERTEHEMTSWMRELELIRRWQPRLNVRGHPQRVRRTYLCVGGGPAPHAYLSVKPSGGEGWTFGPVPASPQYRRSVRRLNDCFGLRDCRRRSETLFPGQLELFSQERAPACVRGAVGTCLAPCATACSQVEYGNRIEAAVAFLTGRDVVVLDRMQAEMKSASENRRFELAARLRDTHGDLEKLSTFLRRLREAQRYSFVYPARGRGGKVNWYLIREGQIMGVQRRPNNARTSGRCLKALDAVFPRGGHAHPPVAPDDLDKVLLVARWFREFPGELQTVLSPDEARKRCGSRLNA